MATNDIQTLKYPISLGGGIIRTYQTEVNKKTGASVTYDVTGLGQKDAILRSDPTLDANGNQTYTDSIVDSYATTYQNLSAEDRRFIRTNLIKEATNQRAAYVNKNFTQDQKNNLFPGMPRVVNTAPPAQQVTPGGTTVNGSNPIENQFDLFSDSNRALVPDAEGQRNNYNDPKGGAWIYPTALRTNGQDYIKFNIVQYEPRQFRLNNETGEILERRNTQKESKGTICLPIQPSISDMNTVDWNGLGVNPLDLGLAQFSMQIGQSQGAQGMENILDYMTTQLKDPGVQNAAKLALAQKAAGVTGLLSRVTGAVVNPNLELLFQGPQLRPFNFSFKLSPRNTDEARIVKGIIRAFKEAMAVKIASSQLFLKAPNVFEIKYVRGRTKDNNEIDPHPSLNKIKTCALQACNVDYTPDGTYMTFADRDATMTSYIISLQFQELEPVTSKDYDENYTEIGY